MFHERLQHALQTKCFLDRGKPVVVGVSGGADSLALLDGMVGCGCDVIVAHLNHSIRAQAAGDAAFVREQAVRRGLPFFESTIDVPALARRERLSLEDGARKARYQFLFAVAKAQNAQAVAVGHNADDQVETVLLHLLQGSGLDGLGGMKPRLLPNPWNSSIPLVRPLLGFWREEIESYCDESGLTPITDHTNQQTVYLRNRIRLELLPLLQSMQPAVKESILRFAETSGTDTAFLNDQTTAAWKSVLEDAGVEWLVFDRARFLHQSPAIQQRLLRRAFQYLAPANRDLDRHAVQVLGDFVGTQSRSGRLGLPGKLRAWLEGETLFMARSGAADLPRVVPQIVLSETLLLPQSGSIELDDTWQVWVETCEPAYLPEDLSDARHAWLDAARLTKPLLLRNPLPGDRFNPLGMDTPVRLSDFWINQRIPARLRQYYPLVVCGDRIAWIPGVRIADWVKATHESTEVIHLWVIQHKRDKASV